MCTQFSYLSSVSESNDEIACSLGPCLGSIVSSDDESPDLSFWSMMSSHVGGGRPIFRVG